jgi:hypothetical protein
MRRRWASMVVIEKGEKQRNAEATQPTGSIVGSGGDKHDIISVYEPDTGRPHYSVKRSCELFLAPQAQGPRSLLGGWPMPVSPSNKEGQGSQCPQWPHQAHPHQKNMNAATGRATRNMSAATAHARRRQTLLHNHSTIQPYLS